MLLDSRLDRLSAQKRDIKSEIKELEKGIDDLFEKMHAAALRVKRASDENEKIIEQNSLDHYVRWFTASEKLLSAKEKELDELDAKIKIIET
jgi:prefoldin subunit 5